MEIEDNDAVVALEGQHFVAVIVAKSDRCFIQKAILGDTME